MYVCVCVVATAEHETKTSSVAASVDFFICPSALVQMSPWPNNDFFVSFHADSERSIYNTSALTASHGLVVQTVSQYVNSHHP